MIKVQINLDKIDKSMIFQGKSGRYLNLILHENRAGRDQYGNDGFAKQDLTKEQRLAGKEVAICGNWKHLVSGQEIASQANIAAKKAQAAAQDDDEIPF